MPRALAIVHMLRYAADPATGRYVALSYATIRARVKGSARIVRYRLNAYDMCGTDIPSCLLLTR